MTDYIDYLLKFADEAEANGVLYSDETPNYQAIDIIGIIYEPTGNTIDTDEGPVPEMAPVPGWHVNVRDKRICPELEEYRVYPESPVRVWALSAEP